MDNTIEAAGGRKFVISMTVILLSTLLVWFAKVDPEVYKYLILVTAGAYMGGNVTQKVMTKTGDIDASKT